MPSPVKPKIEGFCVTKSQLALNSLIGCIQENDAKQAKHFVSMSAFRGSHFFTATSKSYLGSYVLTLQHLNI